MDCYALEPGGWMAPNESTYRADFVFILIKDGQTFKEERSASFRVGYHDEDRAYEEYLDAEEDFCVGYEEEGYEVKDIQSNMYEEE